MFLLFFETGSRSLGLLYTRWASACLCLQSAGIKGIHFPLSPQPYTSLLPKAMETSQQPCPCWLQPDLSLAMFTKHWPPDHPESVVRPPPHCPASRYEWLKRDEATEHSSPICRMLCWHSKQIVRHSTDYTSYSQNGIFLQVSKRTRPHLLILLTK